MLTSACNEPLITTALRRLQYCDLLALLTSSNRQPKVIVESTIQFEFIEGVIPYVGKNKLLLFGQKVILATAPEAVESFIIGPSSAPAFNNMYKGGFDKNLTGVAITFFAVYWRSLDAI